MVLQLLLDTYVGYLASFAFQHRLLAIVHAPLMCTLLVWAQCN